MPPGITSQVDTEKHPPSDEFNCTFSSESYINSALKMASGTETHLIFRTVLCKLFLRISCIFYIRITKFDMYTNLRINSVMNCSRETFCSFSFPSHSTCHISRKKLGGSKVIRMIFKIFKVSVCYIFTCLCVHVHIINIPATRSEWQLHWNEVRQKWYATIH